MCEDDPLPSLGEMGKYNILASLSRSAGQMQG